MANKSIEEEFNRIVDNLEFNDYKKMRPAEWFKLGFYKGRKESEEK